MESWCHGFEDTASQIVTIVKDIEKYTDTAVRSYGASRRKLHDHLSKQLNAERLALLKQVTDILNSFAKDRSGASAVLAEMRKTRRI